MNKESGRNQFGRYKNLILFCSKAFSLLGDKVNYNLLVLSRNISGRLGLVLRYVFLKNSCKKLGDNVSVFTSVFISNVNLLSIGDNVSIHPMSYLDASGGIVIGDNVSIAHNSSILSSNHSWDNLSIPIKYNEMVFSTVHIKNDVWIGCGVRIMSGVIINTRSIIAAGAVVTKDVESNVLCGGIPAVKIKNI